VFLYSSEGVRARCKGWARLGLGLRLGLVRVRVKRAGNCGL
jgi:hypothetical protein